MPVILAACAAVALTAALAGPARDVAADDDGRVIEVVAEVTSSASRGVDGRWWFDARTVVIDDGASRGSTAVPIRVGIAPTDGTDLGAMIRVRGQARATAPGESAALLLFAKEGEVVRPAAGLFGVAASMRAQFLDRAVTLPEPGAGLLPGLAVGDTRAVSDALGADMRVTGLSHLTAVSGANCALVVGAAFWLVALCGGGRRLRVAVAGAALVAFVVLITPEPSVIRAAVMAGAAMLSLLLGRPSAGAGMLALSATVILVADPWLAATPGFALSVAASGALILLAPALATGLGRRMPHPLAVMISVPLSAQLVCGPIVALFAEQQSLVGVATNLVAAPAAPIATVIGLLACLTGALPGLADALAACAWLPAAWIATTAEVAADLPVGQLVLVPGPASATLVAVIGAALGVVVCGPMCGPGTKMPHAGDSDPVRVGGAVARLASMTGRLAHPLSVVVLIIATSLGGAHLVLTGPLAPMAAPDGWSIAACDVGQGDAVLVRSGDRIALVDTGPEPEPLTECLRGLAVDHIDLLVLTHFDLDHVGGVAAVQGRVSRVVHGPPGEEDDERMLETLRRGGAELVSGVAGLRGELGEAQWSVLWPQRESRVFPAGNDASVVMQFEHGGVPRSIFLGDLGAEAQRMLVRAARPAGPFAVVKVAHHGSADQDPGLYEALRPTIGLVSCGVDNDYGHPRRETLDLLSAVGAHVVRTDRQGRILLGQDGGAITIRTESDVGGPD
ncbi:ComEC/Rec2 family competence protein [uncultured Microbacterium sp.]|uniref:ComEC/Rec2 family competence protein n=1 Tax=uncultured Microbacterium sp. TaxID=191216 RepID=UPI0028DB383E|nr:ComEC/Rec2 family competence protein [uncultured Microbacterium sp.]